MQYPVFKRRIRYYRYYFIGLDEPVEIMATYKKEARKLLYETINSTPLLQKRHIIGETVTLPIFGETTEEINGEDYVWVGFENTETGWMKLKDYERAEKI